MQHSKEPDLSSEQKKSIPQEKPLVKFTKQDKEDLPQFTRDPLFQIRNYEGGDNTITTVAVSHNSLAIGTQTGKIFVFNKDLRPEDRIIQYQEHSKKVTGIWLQHGKAVISVSNDSLLFCKSLNKEFQDFSKDLNPSAI
jgi:hypothetical protein